MTNEQLIKIMEKKKATLKAELDTDKVCALAAAEEIDKIDDMIKALKSGWNPAGSYAESAEQASHADLEREISHGND